MADQSGSQDGSRATGWDKAQWSDSRTREPTGSRDGMPRQMTSQEAGSDYRNALHRFLGGSPLSVLIRLLIVSLVVGALLMWLNIHPMDVYHGLRRFAQRIWMLGFDSIREIGTYILAGAAIVVPVWFVLRLLNARGR